LAISEQYNKAQNSLALVVVLGKQIEKKQANSNKKLKIRYNISI